MGIAINAAMLTVEIVVKVSAGLTSLQADSLDFLRDTANYAISLGDAGMAFGWCA